MTPTILLGCTRLSEAEPHLLDLRSNVPFWRRCHKMISLMDFGAIESIKEIIL